MSKPDTTTSTGDGGIKYPFLKMALAPIIGAGIVFQGFPDAQKIELLGEKGVMVAMLILGGLYALEKLVVKAPGENTSSQTVTTSPAPKEDF